MMRSSGIANPEQLAVLNTVLDDICATAGIATESDGRGDIAALLLDACQNGHRSSEQLRAALKPALIAAITAASHI